MDANILISVMGLVVGNGVITAAISKIINHKSQENKILKALAYSQLSDKVQLLIEKGFATSEERRQLSILFDAYTASGWNGDMKSRINKVYLLPLEKS